MEEHMDFLEQIFGWAPDGGDGTFELMLVVGTVVALFVGIVLRRRHHQVADLGASNLADRGNDRATTKPPRQLR